MIFLYSSGIAQERCSYVFSGKVLDVKSKTNLSGSKISILEAHQESLTDSLGNFEFKNICTGLYTVLINYAGYKPDTFTVSLDKNYHRHYYLVEDVLEYKDVEVTTKIGEKRILVSQSQISIRNKELDQTRGGSLGEALQHLTGVYVLQSGPTIFKPVIHGLHSNRILLLNNGVRQEGQQWGSEHAPEIDPFVGTNISVIKGPASIRYGSDAIGGVILVNPATMPESIGITGEMNIIGASNNRLGVFSGILQGALGHNLKGLSWRSQATFRRAGNSKTPYYFLENTGFREFNFSQSVSYTRKRFGLELYYSQFNTSLGIFTGTHAATLADINAAIARPHPLTPSYFSYRIGRPYQLVKHELFKSSLFFKFLNKNRIDFTFARQANVRSEYDYLPLNGNQNPELYLSLVSHSLDMIYQHRLFRSLLGSIGINGITQGNVRLYQMLIPNFRNYTAGIFILEKWRTPRLTIEAGGRYDFKWLRAYMLDINSAKVITPTFNWWNFTASVGTQYYIAKNFSWLFNISNAWRAPTVNELLSNGVHQSAVSFELGNINLKAEKAFNFTTSFRYEGRKGEVEVDLYNNYINDYIYLRPTLTFQNTPRGAFPVFSYTQANTIFRGCDLSLSYNIIDSLTFLSKSSLLFAYNRTIQDYLVMVPTNRFENSLKYEFGKIKKLHQCYFGLTAIYTSMQKRVPANSDYAPSPSAYLLLNADIGCSIAIGKNKVDISISAKNILNTAYRDYMDRFRYFMDQPGRNFTMRLKVPITITKKQ